MWAGLGVYKDDVTDESAKLGMFGVEMECASLAY